MEKIPTKLTPRLKIMRDYLNDGLWHSTKDILDATNDMSVSKAVWYLKEMGYRIEKRYGGMTINGRKITERRLLAF